MTIIAVIDKNIVLPEICSMKKANDMMELSNSEKARAIQNSIETCTLEELGLLHPQRYKQHNINVGDGMQSILDLHEIMPHEQVYTNVIRAFQDGDYGFVHVDYYLFGPTVAWDIHRFENGISVEHWDNLQPTPMTRNKSGRTMTDGKTKAKDHDKTAVNKELVRSYVQEVLVSQNYDAIRDYFEGDLLMQHNPLMGDGVTEFLQTLNEWATQGTPQVYAQIHKVLGEGNFVLVLSEGTYFGRHTAFYDLYRVENGKIVEHWDVIENIPAEADRKNNNGKF
jgi:predicted SnoaL-like aldol condensation-catalyzing enzyme